MSKAMAGYPLRGEKFGAIVSGDRGFPRMAEP